MRTHQLVIARLLVSLISISSLALEPKETSIAGRSVSAILVSADQNLSAAPWPNDRFELITTTITVQPDISIFDLLIANYIEPDVEAFTVIYDLNPSLKKVDPLQAGTSLTLPKVSAGEKLERKLRDGYRVMLTVDAPLREEFTKSALNLQDLSTGFANLPVERFSSPPVREETVANVKGLTAWFAYIRQSFLQRTGPSLRRPTLQGIHDEAALLDSILSRILNDKKLVTQEDQSRINAIYRDIHHQMKKYDEVMAGEPPLGAEQFEVVVTIRAPKAPEEVQVFYAFEGLFRNPPDGHDPSHPFQNAMSGRLPFGDYMIWAGKAGHPFPPLTDQKPIRVDASGGPRQTVELTVIQ